MVGLALRQQRESINQSWNASNPYFHWMCLTGCHKGDAVGNPHVVNTVGFYLQSAEQWAETCGGHSPKVTQLGHGTTGIRTQKVGTDISV